MSLHLVPTLALLGAAVALLALAGVLAARGWRQQRAAVEVDEGAPTAQAEVVEVTAKDVSIAGESSTYYYPTVRFSPPDGQVVVAECLTGLVPPAPHVGDVVEVRYAAEHPDRVELAAASSPVSAGRTSFLLARAARGGALVLVVAWLLLAVLFWR